MMMNDFACTHPLGLILGIKGVITFGSTTKSVSFLQLFSHFFMVGRSACSPVFQTFQNLKKKKKFRNSFVNYCKSLDSLVQEIIRYGLNK